MSSTNELLIINGTVQNEFGILLLILAALIILYILLSIGFQRMRIEKLEKIVALIEAGHKRKISSEGEGKR